MKKKGFTLIELLVVIAIIAMLLAILMPALNKVKRLAQRLICGTNTKGIGTAMQVYANDYADEFPIQGGVGEHAWAWDGVTYEWYNPDWDWTEDKWLTVASSLYLLVRVADVDTKSFVCRSSDQTPFEGVTGTAEVDLVELWDFGGCDIDPAITLPSPQTGTVFYNDGLAKEHQSYSYQLPYEAGGWRARPADSTAGASVAILADKNPWFDPRLTSGPAESSLVTLQRDFMTYIHFICPDVSDWPTDSSTAWQIQIANSQPHGREGQNVLFGDGHSEFEKRSDCSYQNDNIYTMWDDDYTDPGLKKHRGKATPKTDPDPMPGNPSFSTSDEDAFLANDDSRRDTHWQCN